MRVLITLAIAFMFTAAVACQRTAVVTKEMTWECAPEEYKPAFVAKPDDYVRLRFVENPHCFEVESRDDFCTVLRSYRKPVVNVEFQVWGGRWSAQGYRLSRVEGRPLPVSRGWSHSGSNGDFTGPCPIGKVINELR